MRFKFQPNMNLDFSTIIIRPLNIILKTTEKYISNRVSMSNSLSHIPRLAAAPTHCALCRRQNQTAEAQSVP